MSIDTNINETSEKRWCAFEPQIPCFMTIRPIPTDYCTICVEAKKARALYKIADNLRKIADRDKPRK